jgi:hypothetical protein
VGTSTYRETLRFRILDALYAELVEQGINDAVASNNWRTYRKRTDHLLHWIAERVLSEYEFDRWVG